MSHTDDYDAMRGGWALLMMMSGAILVIFTGLAVAGMAEWNNVAGLAVMAAGFLFLAEIAGFLSGTTEAVVERVM